MKETEHFVRNNKKYTENEQQKEFDQAVRLWLKGTFGEVLFWWDFYANPNQYLKYFKRLIKPDVQVLMPDISEMKSGDSILDVGSGPISGFGNRLNSGGQISVTACDPLAPVYKALLTHVVIKPYTETLFAIGERLLDRFEHNQFDAVTMNNALDHSLDPMLVLENLLAVCKIGKKVHLCHAVNEAEHEQYQWNHQWNINLDKEADFILWSKNEQFNVTQELSAYANIKGRILPPNEFGRKWVKIELLKTRDIHPSGRNRIVYDEILHTMMYFFLSPKFRSLAKNNEQYDDMDLIRKLGNDQFHDFGELFNH